MLSLESECKTQIGQPSCNPDKDQSAGNTEEHQSV